MIAYTKDEIEALAQAVGRHWGGLALDWRLVVEPPHRDPPPALLLNIEIALDGATRITTVPLAKPAIASGRLTPTSRVHDDARAVAAVRRCSVQTLLAQSSDAAVEGLLDYLRACGILIMD